MAGGFQRLVLCTIGVLALLAPGVGSSQPPELVPIDPAPRSWPNTNIVISGMSADGGLSVGNYRYSPTRPLRWVEGVVERLSFEPFPLAWAAANGITPDGSVIVGGTDSRYDARAMAWTDGALRYLPRPESSFPLAVAHDVSADGSTIVGTANFPVEGGARKFATRWVDDVMEALPDPIGGLLFTEGLFVSDDGATLGGLGFLDGAGFRGVRWVGDGAEILAAPGPTGSFKPAGMSADGRVFVGYQDDGAQLEAVRWEDGAFEGLGDLPGGIFESRATRVTADGRTVFGSSVVGPAEDCVPSYSCGAEREDFVWTRESGMLPVEEWLRYGCGYDVVNWHIGVHNVSGDGTRLAIGAQRALIGPYQSYLVDIAHCAFDYEVPEWITGVGDYYLADYDNSEIYRVRRDTGELDLVDSFGEIYKPIDVRIGPDRALYVLSGIWERIVRLDPATAEQTIVTSQGLLDYPAAFVLGLDGTPYVFNPERSYQSPAQIIRVDPETGAQSVLSEGDWIERRSLARDENGDLLTLSYRDDVWWVVRIDVETGEQLPLVEIQVEPGAILGKIAYDVRGRRLLARGPVSEILEIDLETGATTPAGPDGIVGYDIEVGSGGDALTISYKTLHRIDAETGEERAIQGWGHLQQPIALEEILARCSDGFDNDGDGLADADDPGCLSPEDDGELHRTDVAIDIEPRDPDNVIRLGPGHRVEVAVLGSDTLDVRDVDPDSLAFGPGEAAPLRPRGVRVDVDRDGHRDLVLRFETAETGIGVTDTEGCLSGTAEDLPFRACDEVRVIPRWCGKGFETALVVPAFAGLSRLRRRRARS